MSEPTVKLIETIRSLNEIVSVCEKKEVVRVRRHLIRLMKKVNERLGKEGK
jgi:hypothetical protein